MSKASCPHDDAVVELLHEDPAFADEYLSAALDEINQPGGRGALLAALRHIDEARHDCRGRTCGNPKGKPLLGIIHEGQPNH